MFPRGGRRRTVAPTELRKSARPRTWASPAPPRARPAWRRESRSTGLGGVALIPPGFFQGNVGSARKVSAFKHVHARGQARTHAARWPGLISRSSGTSPRQRSTAIGQRGWKTHPLGGLSALGTSPPSTTRSRDRKSTRLNSSHLGISYAVFCLKKKKKITKLYHKKQTYQVVPHKLL